MAEPVFSLNEAERPTKAAVLRGAAGKCPACGKGSLFSSYLKVADHCPHCKEPMHHQRADDGPAYLTVFLTSHLAGVLLLLIYMAWRPSPISMIIGFSIGTIIVSLLLLPRFKGGLVGLQWARRMHGFGGAPDSASA